MSKIEIDVATAEFFDAFDNRGGKAADVARIRRLVLPSGVIVKTGPEFEVYTVDAFIEPRQRLLTDGRLVEFSEWEISEQTEIAGDIASRFGEYRKSGILDGEPFEGAGPRPSSSSALRRAGVSQRLPGTTSRDLRGGRLWLESGTGRAALRRRLLTSPAMLRWHSFWPAVPGGPQQPVKSCAALPSMRNRRSQQERPPLRAAAPDPARPPRVESRTPRTTHDPSDRRRSRPLQCRIRRLPATQMEKRPDQPQRTSLANRVGQFLAHQLDHHPRRRGRVELSRLVQGLRLLGWSKPGMSPRRAQASARCLSWC